MRGKPIFALTVADELRITPAHAGKTLQRKKRMKFDEDHPRACGENRCVLLFRCALAGSPPRMRGKLAEVCEV